MSRIRLKVQAAVAVLLLLLIAVELNVLARRYGANARVDLSSSGRWTLAPATRDSLAAMQRRFEDTVRQDEEGQKRALTQRERDDLRVHLELYTSGTPPPEYADYFRETESRVEDLRAAAGDFLRVEIHRLDPERSRLEIERAEQEGLSPIPNLDAKGRAERLWCGLVLRYAERKESAKNAIAPFDVEAWFVRHLDSFLETEPALVCVLVEEDLKKTPLARPGLEDLQSFQQELSRWIQKQYPDAMQGSPRAQEAQQEAQRLSQAHAPEVLAKDLRYLLRGSVTVRPLARIDGYNKLPVECRLLVLMRPSPTTLGAEGVEQIASYLRRGGNVLAFVPRYEPTELQQQQFKQNDLGELGHYLEGLGVRVRSEVVAQQAPAIELQTQQQGQSADTVGRRRARSQRLPFLLRLDRADPAEESTGAAVEIALLRALREALIELRTGAEQRKAAPVAERDELLGELGDTARAWGEVWAAEERGAKAIEGELGLWPPAQEQQRLDALRQRLELRREDVESAATSREAAELALRDIEAQIASGERGAASGLAALQQERAALATDLAQRATEVETLRALVAEAERVQRAANLVRKAYLTWRSRFELSGEVQRQEQISRRAFVRELRESLGALEAGRVLSPEARDAVDNFLGSFDLLYSLDAYRGGARAVVDAIAAHLP
ncbi:MAG: Gldg family protein, partial [Planctomycetes bacterium]|nr:Gldg family protein [Planctomycetota bacterium]